jgi:hypothetical protein
VYAARKKKPIAENSRVKHSPKYSFCSISASLELILLFSGYPVIVTSTNKKDRFVDLWKKYLTLEEDLHSRKVRYADHRE